MKYAKYEMVTINPELNMHCSIDTLNSRFVDKHWHNSIEILYIIEGTLDITLPNEGYTLLEQDYIIIDRNIVHSTTSKSTCRYLLIQIPYTFLKEYIPHINSFRIPCICSLKQKDNRNILNSMRGTLMQLSSLYQNKYDGYYLEYYSILFHFLHLLVTDYKQDISHLSLPNTDKYIERLSLITEYVQDHYREPISLQDASELLSLNPEYFSRFFKKYMGVTFLEYVYSVRLQAAYQELINTDLPIQQVQEHNGFTNPKIFSRMFREQYGTTPREIRKSTLLKSRS